MIVVATFVDSSIIIHMARFGTFLKGTYRPVPIGTLHFITVSEIVATIVLHMHRQHTYLCL